MPQQQQQQWAGQDNVGSVAANRLSMQQQQNPMLNAQLTVSFIIASLSLK